MRNRESATPREDRKSFSLKKLAVAAGALIVVFLLGYLPSRMSAENAQQRNAQLQYDLKLANLEAQLGMASYEANQNNYAIAAQQSTAFFNGLLATINTTSDKSLKQNLERMLAGRDEITANIAEANPAVKEKLAHAYADLFNITAAQQTREQRR